MQSKKIVYSSLAILLSSALTAVATPPDVSVPTTVVPTPIAPPAGSTNFPVSKRIQLFSNIVMVDAKDSGTAFTLPLHKILWVSLEGRIEGDIEYQWVPDLCWKDSSIYTQDSILEMIDIEKYFSNASDLNMPKVCSEHFFFLPRLVGSTMLSFKLIKTVKDTNLNPYGQAEVLDSVQFKINVVSAEEVGTQSAQ